MNERDSEEESFFNAFKDALSVLIYKENVKKMRRNPYTVYKLYGLQV